MKKQYIITLILCCTLFAGCNFSKGANKDLRTGLSYSYNGFRVEDVVLVDSVNRRMTDNKVQINTRIGIVAAGVSNYTLKDGKAFPGMMLVVTDKNETPVLSNADLFEGSAGNTPTDASQLIGKITLAKPIVAGETYHLKLRIWDKLKTDNVLNIETDLVVK